jgi:NAD(P)-dependent dehydrogenase (short-subunit alcohol dehydrogenase family)
VSRVLFDFSGRTVVVTGGTSGIGRVLADAFRDAGADVVITGTRDRSDYDDDFDGLTLHRLDLAEPDDIRRFASSIDACDVLVNNAGALHRDPSELTADGFARTVEVNLTGTFRLCELLHPLLRRSGDGAVVNFASMLALFGSPRVPAYAATKGALISLTKSLAQAWAPDGIRVNVVAPGWIDTPLMDAHVRDPERNAGIVARTPLGRWGRPDDVVGPVLFLASDAACFITGALLTVDGGYSSS